MVVGFLGEAAWQSTPKRSKTVAAQRLSSTFRWSEWRRAVPVCKFERLVPAAIAHLAVSCRMITPRQFLECFLYDETEAWVKARPDLSSATE